MKFWNRIRILKLIIQLIRDPNRTDLIFKGVKIVSSEENLKALKNVENYILSKTEFMKMYEEKFLSNTPKLAELAKLPKESFGYGVYLHMSKNNLDFEIFPKINVTRPIEYLSARIYQDHDLWHVLLDCTTSVEDELAIQAFSVAQFNSPIAVLIIAGGLIHLLSKDPIRAISAFKKINAYYLIGKNSNFLLNHKLYDYLNRPLKEVKSNLLVLN